MVDKRERNKARAQEREKLTNWMMINMTYCFLAVVILEFVRRGYASTRPIFGVASVLAMPTVLTVVFALTAVLAACLIIFSKLGKIKNTERAFNYAILLIVISLCCLFLVFFPQIRMLLPFLRNTHSYVGIWSLMSGVGIFLVGSFVFYGIKIRKI